MGIPRTSLTHTGQRYLAQQAEGMSSKSPLPPLFAHEFGRSSSKIPVQHRDKREASVLLSRDGVIQKSFLVTRLFQRMVQQQHLHRASFTHMPHDLSMEVLRRCFQPPARSDGTFLALALTFMFLMDHGQVFYSSEAPRDRTRASFTPSL